MKIYLDNCCYCRPFDNLSQRRIRQEAQAVVDAVEFCKTNGHGIVSSATVNKEMNKISNKRKLAKVKTFYRDAAPANIRITPDIIKRGRSFLEYGVHVPDCFHLACAEAAGAAYLLTTDIPFIEASAKIRLAVRVINPLTFLSEWRQ